MPFRIYKVQGDGNLHFVEAVQDFVTAIAHVHVLSKSWPGQYAIHDEETGERVFIPSRDTIQ